MSATPVDHAALAVAELAAQFSPLPVMAGIARAIGNRANALESLWLDLRDKRTLAAAEGANLDTFGPLVGAKRKAAQSDASYRGALAAAMLRNRSKGTADELIAICKAVVGATAVHVFGAFPAAFVINLQVTAPLTAEQEAELVAFVLASKSVAIGIQGIAWYTGPVFGFLGYPDPPFKGYGDGAGSGGKWAHYIWP